MTSRDELREARELSRAVGDLPRELRPARDLWPEIAGRLEPRGRRVSAGGWWHLAAAMALVALGLAAAVALRPADRPVERAAAVAERPAVWSLAAAHQRQRDGVMHVHNDLVAVIARREARLDETGAAALIGGLAELERAAADIEQALAEHPDDRRLRLTLAAAYRRESDWTTRLGRV